MFFFKKKKKIYPYLVTTKIRVEICRYFLDTAVYNSCLTAVINM